MIKDAVNIFLRGDKGLVAKILKKIIHPNLGNVMYTQAGAECGNSPKIIFRLSNQLD